MRWFLKFFKKSKKQEKIKKDNYPDLSCFERRLEELEKKLEQSLSLNRELAKTIAEFHENNTNNTVEEDSGETDFVSFERFDLFKQNVDKDQESTRENFIHLRKKQKELFDKFDGLLEVLADNMIKKEEIPDIFSSDLTLRKIMREMKDTNKALLVSIVFLLKKQLEEKGTRI